MGVLIKERRRTFEAQKREEGHVKMEAEVGVTVPQAKEGQSWKFSPLEPLEGSTALLTPQVWTSGFYDYEENEFLLF